MTDEKKKNDKNITFDDVYSAEEEETADSTPDDISDPAEERSETDTETETETGDVTEPDPPAPESGEQFDFSALEEPADDPADEQEEEPPPSVHETDEKRKTMKIMMISAGILVFLVLVISSLMDDSDDDAVENAPDILKSAQQGQKKIQQREVTPAMLTRTKKQDTQENAAEQVMKKKKRAAERPRKQRKRRRKPSGGNYKRDKSVVEKYRQVNPAAAAGNAADAAAMNAGKGQYAHNRAKRRHFKSGIKDPQRGGRTGRTGGDDQKHRAVRQKLKARLLRSIVSTARIRAKARLLQGTETIPQGTICYGRARSFSNKRAYVSFSECITPENQKYAVTGIAVEGGGTVSESGLSASVTKPDNFRDNLGIEAAKAAGDLANKAAEKATGGVVGSAADSQVDDTVNQKKKERVKAIYKVEPGMIFYIDFD